MKFISIFLLAVSLYAQTINSLFDVEFASVKFAEAKMSLSIEESHYEIRVDAKTVGLASLLTRDRREFYLSRGRVKDGVLLPEEFIKRRVDNRKEKKQVYKFDYKSQTIALDEYRNGIKKSKTLDKWIGDDLLTLFFNMSIYLKKGLKKFDVVGGKGKKVTIERPEREELELIKTLLDKRDGNFIIATIYQKIFLSNRGELYISLDSDNLCDKAVLKDVIGWGDILGIRRE
jgi:hypothetical protein